MKLIAICLFLFSLTGYGASPSVDDLLNTVDELYRSNSSYAKVEMEVITPHWERKMKLDMWSKGLDKTFIRILSPKKDKGVATLRVKNNMWNYFPKIDRTIKIPPSMRMGAWMGSDFTNDDLVKETTLKKDYSSRLVSQESEPHYIIELKPRKGTVSVWDKIQVFILKKNMLPTKQEFYDERGNLVRTLLFKDIKVMDGRTLPSVMELIPHKKKGQKTIVRYLKAEFDKGIKKSIFTRKNLQKRR